MTTYYALTVSRSKQPIWISHYQEYNEYLAKKLPLALHNPHYERGKTNEYLHYHSLLEYPTNKRQPSLYVLNRPGFSVTFTKLQTNEDIKRWKQYIIKDSHIETKILNEEHQLQAEFEESLIINNHKPKHVKMKLENPK